MSPLVAQVRSLLILDDDPLVLRMVAREIKREGRQDLCAYYCDRSSSAYDIASSHSLDLAIVDLRLTELHPDGINAITGIEVVRRLKEIKPSLVAMIWSACLSVECVDLARDAGASFCREKSTPVRQILLYAEGSRSADVLSLGTKTLARAEWEHIQRVLRDTDHNVSEAARRLGIDRSVLQRKLKRQAPPQFARVTR